MPRVRCCCGVTGDGSKDVTGLSIRVTASSVVNSITESTRFRSYRRLRSYQLPAAAHLVAVTLLPLFLQPVAPCGCGLWEAAYERSKRERERERERERDLGARESNDSGGRCKQER